MENIQKPFKLAIQKIYAKASYLDKYGGSAIITLIVIILFALFWAYMYVNAKIQPIKSDWVNQRCSPAVMPFAGLINPPAHDTPFNFTTTNFSDCTLNILKGVLSEVLAPVYAISNLTTEAFKVITEAVDSIRKLMSNLRTMFTSITQEIFSRILGMTTPVLFLFVKLKDVFAKTTGTLSAVLMTILGIYMTLKSVIGAMLEFLIIMLIALVAAMIIMWIFPWTWPVAIIMTAIFVAISIPTGIMAYWFGVILNVSQSESVPQNTCFDEYTQIRTLTGNKNIKEIRVGERLHGGSYVTAIFKLARDQKNMYDYHGIIISGSHKILTNTGEYISVSDHPASRRITNYHKPYVYCLNTSNKEICINNHLFSDWDEIDKNDWKVIGVKGKKYLPAHPNKIDFHKYLDSGFSGDTIISLKNGKEVKIRDVTIHDVLQTGEKVLGIVEIDTADIVNIKEYIINEKKIIGGPNIQFIDNNLGNTTTLKMKGKKIYDINKLYHLITDTKYITINEIKFYDYNGVVESMLEGPYFFIPQILIYYL